MPEMAALASKNTKSCAQQCACFFQTDLAAALWTRYLSQHPENLIDEGEHAIICKNAL